MLAMTTLNGLVDWHVADTAATIKNKRREGWSDAKITQWLLSVENRKTGSRACPWGCDDEKVAAAFEYLETGYFPTGTRCKCPDGDFDESCCKRPSKPTPGASFSFWDRHRTKILIGGGILGAAAIGGVVYARRR